MLKSCWTLKLHPHSGHCNVVFVVIFFRRWIKNLALNSNIGQNMRHSGSASIEITTIRDKDHCVQYFSTDTRCQQNIVFSAKRQGSSINSNPLSQVNFRKTSSYHQRSFWIKDCPPWMLSSIESHLPMKVVFS